MNDLVLNLRHDGEICLPGEIANSTLTLAQIGAIVCVAAIASGEVNVSEERMGSPEMKAAVDELRVAGIIAVNVSGNTVKIEIQLEKALPGQS